MLDQRRRRPNQRPQSIATNVQSAPECCHIVGIAAPHSAPCIPPYTQPSHPHTVVAIVVVVDLFLLVVCRCRDSPPSADGISTRGRPHRAARRQRETSTQSSRNPGHPRRICVSVRRHKRHVNGLPRRQRARDPPRHIRAFHTRERHGKQSLESPRTGISFLPFPFNNASITLQQQDYLGTRKYKEVTSYFSYPALSPSPRRLSRRHRRTCPRRGAPGHH